MPSHDSEANVISKRQRIEDEQTPTTSKESTPSLEPSAPDSSSQPDCDEPDARISSEQGPTGSQELQIHLSDKTTEDRHEYESVRDSQSTTQFASSQSLVELEEHDNRVAIASTLRQGVVPDSQNSPGSRWSQQVSGLAVSPPQAQPTSNSTPESPLFETISSEARAEGPGSQDLGSLQASPPRDSPSSPPEQSSSTSEHQSQSSSQQSWAIYKVTSPRLSKDLWRVAVESAHNQDQIANRGPLERHNSNSLTDSGFTSPAKPLAKQSSEADEQKENSIPSHQAQVSSAGTGFSQRHPLLSLSQSSTGLATPNKIQNTIPERSESTPQFHSQVDLVSLTQFVEGTNQSSKSARVISESPAVLAQQTSSESQPAQKTIPESPLVASSISQAAQPKVLFGSENSPSIESQPSQASPIASSSTLGPATPAVRPSPTTAGSGISARRAQVVRRMGDSDGSSPGSRRSAVDELRELWDISEVEGGNADTHTEQDGGDLADTSASAFPRELTLNPSQISSEAAGNGAVFTGEAVGPIISQPRLTAAEELQEQVKTVFGATPVDTPTPAELTISPADISKDQPTSSDADLLPSLLPPVPVFPTDLPDLSSNLPYISQDNDIENATSSEPDVAQPSDWSVTLPLTAGGRSVYEDTVLKYRHDITEFGNFLQTNQDEEPEPELVSRIDRLFGALLNVCDYPPDLIGSSLEDLTGSEKARAAFWSNSKFNFLQEFLGTIEKKMHILITARACELLYLLGDLLESLGIGWASVDLDRDDTTVRQSIVQVRLALSENTSKLDFSAFNVIIGFDNSFNGSELAKSLSSRTPSITSPMVLLLRSAYTLEHIEMNLNTGDDDLDKKGALLAAITRTQQYIHEPERHVPEPSEVAKDFVGYLNGLSDSIDFKTLELPEDILDVFDTAQTQHEPLEDGAIRKRPLVGHSHSSV